MVDPRKVKRASALVGHNFHCIWIGHIFLHAWRLQGSHLHRISLHQPQERREVLGARQRLVALHVDVHICINCLRDLVHPIRAAAMLVRGHARVPAVLAANIQDFLRVGGDNHVGEHGRGLRGVIDTVEHCAPVDLAKNLARQARRGNTGRNNGDRFHPHSFHGQRWFPQVQS